MTKIYLTYIKSNPTINISITNHFKTIKQDPNIDGIEIKSKSNPEIKYQIPREDFKDFITENEYLDSNKLDKHRQSQRLFISKPNLFPPKGKKRVVWNVIYEGRPIKVTILDPFFIDKINGGLRIAQGDSMLVDMRIVSVFDKLFNTHIDKSFEVLTVLDYDERPPQNQTGLKLD